MRFDGVRFTVFDTATTPAIHANEVEALLEDRRGNLWLGTNGGGLNRLADGRFERYTTQDGLAGDFVRCLLKIATAISGSALGRRPESLSRRTLHLVDHEGRTPDDHVRALAQGPNGDLGSAPAAVSRASGTKG